MPLVTVNAPLVNVIPLDEQKPFFTQHLASATLKSGERIDIMTVVGEPLRFFVRGSKLVAEFDIQSVIQEAIIHVAKENAA